MSELKPPFWHHVACNGSNNYPVGHPGMICNCKGWAIRGAQPCPTCAEKDATIKAMSERTAYNWGKLAEAEARATAAERDLNKLRDVLDGYERTCRVFEAKLAAAERREAEKDKLLAACVAVAAGLEMDGILAFKQAKAALASPSTPSPASSAEPQRFCARCNARLLLATRDGRKYCVNCGTYRWGYQGAPAPSAPREAGATMCACGHALHPWHTPGLDNGGDACGFKGCSCRMPSPVCEAGAQPYGCYQCGSQHNTHPPIVLRRGKLTSLLFCSPGCRSAYQPPSPAPVTASEPT
jgi:hypothetical protein